MYSNVAPIVLAKEPAAANSPERAEYKSPG